MRDAIRSGLVLALIARRAAGTLENSWEPLGSARTDWQTDMNENANDALGYNRRDFLKSGSFATLMTMMGGVELLAQDKSAPATDIKSVAKVKVAVIGLGGWGGIILDTLGKLDMAQGAGICDTYGAFLRRSGK